MAEARDEATNEVRKPEYIEREYAIQFLEEHMTDVVEKSKTMVKDVYLMAKNHAKNYLSIIPAADVVEVVRCEECIYAKPYERQDGETGYYCQNNNSTFRYGTNWERLYEPIREADGFCSYGERKENGNL